MFELLVLRHAKSDWHSGAASDHDRPLNPRGRRAAADVGRFLAATGRLPPHVLCSTARRTRETVERLLEAAQDSDDSSDAVDVVYSERLYEATADGWLDCVRELAPEQGERLLVVGHEPACSAVVSRLTGATVRFPTAAVASIALRGGIAELRPGLGELHWFLPPRLLAAL
ncbi:MAG: histidine phosphatase family protein [Acidobacteria bacterium]|nr:MAG: histidine phosphatase family protein [Acidobacteriota bacterium]REK08399.1 MAG: histidine phosphatase family protein [Acidobacteriota bacterium]